MASPSKLSDGIALTGTRVRTLPLVRTRPATEPQRVITRASSPSRTPATRASCACTSMNGSGR